MQDDSYQFSFRKKNALNCFTDKNHRFDDLANYKMFEKPETKQSYRICP